MLDDVRTGAARDVTRLVYVSAQRLPTVKAEGAQSVRMAEAFARRGFETHLVFPTAPDRDTIIAPLTKHYEVADHVCVTSVGGGFGWCSSAFPPLGAYLVRALYISQGVVRLRPDVVYTRDVALAFWLTARRVPTMLEIMTLPAGVPRCLLGAVLRSSSLRGVLGITKKLAADVQSMYPDARLTIRALPVGVDLRQYGSRLSINGARLALGYEGPQWLVVYTGGMRADRGVDVLVDAARLLPGVRFVLVGGRDVEVQAIREKAQAAGAQNVRVAGHLEPARARLWQAAADVLALPQRGDSAHLMYYTSPAKLFEYMAAERPVVASAVPCLEELLRHRDNALLVDDDGAAWAKAIGEALTDDGLRRSLVRRARAEVVQYTWDARVDLLVREFLGVFDG